MRKIKRSSRKSHKPRTISWKDSNLGLIAAWSSKPKGARNRLKKWKVSNRTSTKHPEIETIGNSLVFRSRMKRANPKVKKMKWRLNPIELWTFRINLKLRWRVWKGIGK